MDQVQLNPSVAHEEFVVQTSHNPRSIDEIAVNTKYSGKSLTIF